MGEWLLKLPGWPHRLRWLGPVVIVATVGLLTVNEWSYRTGREGIRVVEANVAKSNALLKLHRFVLSAESAQRGFLLTGESQYRELYGENLAAEALSLQELRQLYRNAQGQVPDWLTQVERLTETKLSKMDQTMALYDAGEQARALELLHSGIGFTVMTQLDVVLRNALAQEIARTDKSLASLSDALLLQRVGIAVLVMLVMLAVLLLMRQTRRALAEREDNRLSLQAERDRLEVDVAARTRDLSVLAEHLQDVREDERAHLARELHDELGGLLTAAKLDVARIKNRLHQPEHATLVAERLQHLVQTLDAGISLKRRIIEDLRPSTLSNLGLTTALEVLCNDFAARSDATMQAEIEDVRLSPKGQLTAYRLVQEALTNIGKYANATQVRVSLRPVGDGAEIEIEDDGVGFDVKHVRQGAHGLAGMRFRVEATGGGKLVISSRPGGGTRITARLAQLAPPAANQPS